MFDSSIVPFSVSSSKPTTTISQTLALTHACTHTGWGAMLQVGAGGKCVFASTHTKLCQLMPDAFSCDIPGVIPTRQVQRWHGSIPPLACPRWTHLVSLSASTCRSTSQNFAATLWPFWRPGTAVEHRWSWMDLQRDHLYLFHMQFELCPHCCFFFIANVLSMYFCWSGSVYSGNTWAALYDRWHLDPTFHSALWWIHANRRVQYCTEVSPTAGGAHYTDNIRCHADWPALLQIWCSG